MNRPKSIAKSQKTPSLSALLLPFKTLKAFKDAFALQKTTIKDFYARANTFNCPQCSVGGIPSGMLDLKRNVFSTLFLGVTRKIAITDRYMPLYAMVNQCMRAWVTACDNVLDDEYKVIFEFPDAGEGDRMRSILTIMVAERVLSSYVMETYSDPELLRVVETLSLQSLVSSAVQESEEEGAEIPILPPDQIIADVHKRKTADLFVAPLVLPFELEKPDFEVMNNARRAMENFALGCQIIDDVKDMAGDVCTHRHNLLVSLLADDRGEATIAGLRAEPMSEWSAWDRFPKLTEQALVLSQSYFETAFEHMEALGILIPAKKHVTIMQLICKLLRVPFAN